MYKYLYDIRPPGLGLSQAHRFHYNFRVTSNFLEKMDVDKIICIQVEMVLFLSNKDKNLPSRVMRKTFCICDNKGADQLRSNCEADQHLCFRYTDSTIPFLSKSKISSLYPSSVLVQLSLCWICSEITFLVFS